MRIFIFTIFILIFPPYSLAHHGVGAQFDLSQIIELRGEVKRLLWRNPHVRITLAVTNEQGEVEDWVVEAQSVSMLRQRDITQKLFNVGDELLLAGNPAHRGKHEIYAMNVLLPDGREMLFAQRAEPRWNDSALGATGARFVSKGDTSRPELGLFRTWSSPEAFDRILDFESLPLTNTAREQLESYNRLTDNLGMGDCVPRGMPTVVGTPYPREFIDEGDRIILRLEEYDVVRTIYLSPPSGPEPGPSPIGYSQGHWEGNTLVVKTTKISDSFFYENITFSDDIEILERITPSTDGSEVDYSMTITDPTAFTQPVELNLKWIYIPGLTVEEYGCIEG